MNINIKFILCIVGLLVLAVPFNAYAQPVGGACCFPNGTCSFSNDKFDCEEGIGNIYQGDDTDCDPNPCQQVPTPIPTMNEWGMIIFMILAGSGAAVYLRRQRRA